MVVGDLVKYIRNCDSNCSCVFCLHKSNRFGIVTESWVDESDSPSIIAQFDFGENGFHSLISKSHIHSIKNLEIVTLY